MSDHNTYKQIIGYMDDFHRDIGKLTVLTERLMEEQGWSALASQGNRASWQLSSHYAMPERWRIPHVARFYGSSAEEPFETTILYLIVLDKSTSFDFPVILCARLAHPPMTEKDIYNQIYRVERLTALAHEEAPWKAFRKKDGWFVVEPDFDVPVTTLQGYLLNLYDIVDRQHVMNNIVLPLTSFDRRLDEAQTVERHPFPAFVSGDDSVATSP